MNLELYKSKSFFKGAKMNNMIFKRILYLPKIVLVFLFLNTFMHILLADDLNQYKMKREEKFEFEVKPIVTKQENSCLISFTTKNFCDVAICVVNNEDKIVRHIVSGVLGDNAPAPLIKNSLKQEIKWDLKDDQGKYIDSLENVKVQVSLGLKPEFERTMFWDPQRKLNDDTPVLKSTKDGMLVFNGAGVDHLILYSHNGVYLRTIYPYPRDNLKNISDLTWQELPQGGKFPKKHSLLMQTLLTSGNNAPDINGDKHGAMHGFAATAIAVDGNKVALIKKSINRLFLNSADSSIQQNGPVATNFKAINPNSPYYGPKIADIYPKSTAFSPDGKWLYLAGYYHLIGDPRGISDHNCLHGVTRVAYDKNEPYEVFLGKMSIETTNNSNSMMDAGNDNELFTCATSVACDNVGRIYVSDYMNHRIQIYSDDKKFLKTIKTPFPTKIFLHPVTNEIFVLSWVIENPKLGIEERKNFSPTLISFGPFENPVQKEKYDLPFLKSRGIGQGALPRGGPEGSLIQAELDLWSEKPKLWVAATRSDRSGIYIYELKDKKCELKLSMEDSVKENLGFIRGPNEFPQVQNLYVNQKTGFLYIGEPDSLQNFSTLVEINLHTGKCNQIKLPFQTVDMGFDVNGLIYLRKVDIVGRFDMTNWKEIPFDYGVEAEFTDERSGKKISLVSCLPIPSIGTNQTYQGGMSISPNGNIAISCVNSMGEKTNPIGKVSNIKYKPPVYPGKLITESIHIWDKHGKIVAEDAVSGLGRVDGVWLDAGNNLYVMSVYHRMLKNKTPLSKLTSTLMKFSFKKGRLISDAKIENNVPVALPVGSEPERSPELYGNGNIWVEGSEWIYGGVGFSGQHLPGGCCCWHANLALDFYGRSFAAEVDQYDVAVLDTNGNLILKIGKYGNLDDGIPLIKEGGPVNPRSIGGDEVGLFHAAFVATHSDKRVYIADYGNGRVVSVKLSYHNTVNIALEKK